MVEALRNAELGLLFDRIISSQPRLMLVGETGTGKSSLVRHLFSKAIERGQIEEQPESLVVLNMAAIPTELAESTLFGHVPGAFTSASTARRGAFEDARGGVLFLDEIHHAPPTVQRKLLVALQDREFTRLGEAPGKKRKLDTWVMAGTTEPSLIEAELRHRLGDFILQLKPLRRRKRAFAAIVEALLARITRERWPQRMQGQSITVTPSDAVKWLAEQAWPGNIRELESVLRTASFFVAEPKNGISFDQLQKAYSMRKLVSSSQSNRDERNRETMTPGQDQLQDQLMECVHDLHRTNGLPDLEQWKSWLAEAYHKKLKNKSQAARTLGIDIKTFNRLLGHQQYT